ncbi:DEAD/DEAH box helicase [Sandaracinobacter sp. RS1-74]|uniref:DEAD/DEAH box helicase n=1 Tax=Sandaracinobacteroides sayramensis TaxID=2913411 RepID=UPI001EDAFB53|nr:DEAD/DEAH box helicase [Sandaracinobacteroides sayramensis]MCG2842773.1 DEAD/DEAH box helicase [Sandaracinobacteroides sayramensis]
MTNFESLGLAQPLLMALAEEGYETPTPIQLQAIPPALEGKDLLGIAQTGTGKTAAFALPILHYLIGNPAPRRKMAPRVLVLAPTRELATQIADSFRAYARFQKLTILTVFGGVPIPRQEKQLVSGADVLVATPGRLLDLVDRRSLLLDQVEVLVLDEADQMLDLGFIHALKRIAQIVPRQRQSLFFSATMPNSISELAGRYLRNPVKVEVTPVATTAEKIQQFVTHLNQAEKQALLTLTLKKPEFAKCLVFTRTKHGADRVVRHLQGAGVRSAAIHGNKSQPQRERALDQFKRGEIGVLVATDIAARGIDIDAVSHVINFELPNVPEQYVHRIGRTARAGREGVAVSFCAPDEKPYLKDIEKLTRQKLEPLPLPANFLKEAEKLPKPVPVRPGQEREDHARSGEVGSHRHAPRSADGRQGGGRGGQRRHGGGPRRAGEGPAREGQAREGQSREGRSGEGRASHAHPIAGRSQAGRPAGKPHRGRGGGNGGGRPGRAGA